MRETTPGLECPRRYRQIVALRNELGEAADERIPTSINGSGLDVDQTLADTTGFVTEQFKELHHESPLPMEVVRLIA